MNRVCRQIGALELMTGMGFIYRWILVNSILLTFLQNVACFSWTASLQSFLDKHAGEKDPNTRRGCAAEAYFAEIPQTAVRSWPSCESASNGGLIQQLKKKGISDSDPAEKGNRESKVGSEVWGLDSRYDPWQDFSGAESRVPVRLRSYEKTWTEFTTCHVVLGA